MQPQLKQSILWPAVLVFFVLSVSSAFAEVEYVYGKAVSNDSRLEFIEEHSIKYENGRIAHIKTVYYDADLNKIGEQVSDFSHGPQFGSYDFIDNRLRYENGAQVMTEAATRANLRISSTSSSAISRSTSSVSRASASSMTLMA